MGDEEDEQRLKPRKMSIDDEFMQHPDSGAFIRNPLKQSRSTPILLSASEYNHNVLDDALGDWHQVCVSESSLREMMQTYSDSHGLSLPEKFGSRLVKSQSRAHVGRVHSLANGFDFVVQLRKSTYVQPRNTRRRAMGKEIPGSVSIEKLQIEVTEIDGGTKLRVENITDGLVLAWNKTHTHFMVKIGDVITKVNDRKGNAKALVEEMHEAQEVLRITVQRANFEKTRDQEHRGSPQLDEADATLLPIGNAGGDMSAGSLAKPKQAAGAARKKAPVAEGAAPAK